MAMLWAQISLRDRENSRSNGIQFKKRRNNNNAEGGTDRHNTRIPQFSPATGPKCMLSGVTLISITSAGIPRHH
jgi:hypothetical protein